MYRKISPDGLPESLLPIEVDILKAAFVSDSDIYGYAFRSYEVNNGTIYKAFSRLAEWGLLDARDPELGENGKGRNPYTISSIGLIMIAEHAPELYDTRTVENVDLPENPNIELGL